VRKSVKEADSIANRLEKELAEQQQELDFANSKIKNIQPYFQQVLAVIKKNVILREKGKLKEAVAQIQELME
jgi:hypothetical protein